LLSDGQQANSHRRGIKRPGFSLASARVLLGVEAGTWSQGSLDNATVAERAAFQAMLRQGVILVTPGEPRGFALAPDARAGLGL
jgi:hypothetical protein